MIIASMWSLCDYDRSAPGNISVSAERGGVTIGYEAVDPDWPECFSLDLLPPLTPEQAILVARMLVAGAEFLGQQEGLRDA